MWRLVPPVVKAPALAQRRLNETPVSQNCTPAHPHLLPGTPYDRPDTRTSPVDMQGKVEEAQGDEYWEVSKM